MRSFIPLLLACLLLPIRVAAQDHLAHGASGLTRGIPDFCALAIDRLVIPANTATIIPAGTNRACIGVQGIATVPSGARIEFDNLMVYAGGKLFVEAGAELVFRGNPLDLATDPEQFGEGLIAFGDVTMRGLVNGQPTIRIHSAKPDGARGHLLLTGRGDTLIEGTITEDLGRTDASRPIDDTTFSGDTVTHLGTNPKGRYGGWHLHHRFGPLPGSGQPYQFVIRQNRMLRGGKWGGVVAHNSSFGLIAKNETRFATGYCYVEEDGSETQNQWIGNYCGQSIDPTRCAGDQGGYDPEARCPGGFWLRGQNQILRDNVVEDTGRGITWWTLCLESSGPPCGGDVRLTSPLVPGADTTDPAQIHADCRSWSGGDQIWKPTACTVFHQPGQIIDGNLCRRTTTCFEFWWTNRFQKASPPITNSLTENVQTPIFLRYSDIAFDGFTATGCGTFLVQGNDGSTTAVMPGETSLRHVTATCRDAVFAPVGQLQLGPAYRFSDSTFTTPNGLALRLGGQKAWCCSMTTSITVENSTFSGPVFTQPPPSSDPAPGQLVVIRQRNVNGVTREDRLTYPGRDPDPEVALATPGVPMTGNAPPSPPAPPVIVPPVVVPPVVITPAPGTSTPPAPQPATVRCTVQSVSVYADKDAKLTVRCDTNGSPLIPKGFAFTVAQ